MSNSYLSQLRLDVCCISRLPWWRHINHNLEHYFLTGAPFMDSVFYPADVQVSRPLWMEGDRNMSEFFIYAYANFSWYGNPTPKNILGVHWDMTIKEEIQRYLALNTTENSTTLWNYRQKECAFWTEYLPSVISYITPTYPPTTEFWWEPESPLQIAFWSINSICLFLLVMVVVCCLLWRNAKRMSKERYVDAGSLASLKQGLGGDFSGRASPALSHRSGITGKTMLENHDGVSLKSFQGGILQPSPSTHSLRSLGLTRLPAPSQPHSRQPSLHGLPAQGPLQGLPGLPLTPAVTPALQHRQMGPPHLSQPYTINGVAVGPGEIPNGAGPFVNGGLHNTSDDSIRSGQAQAGPVMFDPRGSQRSQMVANMGGLDTSLESVGGTRHPQPGVQVLPLQPLSGAARPHTKLVPGRMSGAKSPGPVTRSQGLPARPESRTSSRQNNRSNIIPSTAV